MIRLALPVACIALVLAGASVFVSALVLRDGRVRDDAIAQEGAARRDQNCLLFEREHQGAVRSLAKTYAYLSALPPEEKGTALNKAVKAQLPETEQRAKTLIPPSYCNEPGVGLRESEHTATPKRPKELGPVGTPPP